MEFYVYLINGSADFVKIRYRKHSIIWISVFPFLDDLNKTQRMPLVAANSGFPNTCSGYPSLLFSTVIKPRFSSLTFLRLHAYKPIKKNFVALVR
jgi:hypothetical protein